jgi:hypothetical protein
MINLLVTYDNQDFELGEYFTQSYNMLKERIINSNISFFNLDGENCTEAMINYHTEAFIPNQFIFIGLSHGTYEELNTSSDFYVSKSNSHNFSNSFFYTSACSCSAILGKLLIDKGCLAFIGYDDEIHVLPDYYHEFIECENHGIIEFINTSKTIGEVYKEMHQKYDLAIERLANGDIIETIVAATLVDNKQLLRLLGDDNLNITNFITEI